MKNQNSIIIFLAFLMILLFIPAVCASDLSDAAESAALPSSDISISDDLQYGDAGAIVESTDSPLSFPDSDDANSRSFLGASTNSHVSAAKSDGNMSNTVKDSWNLCRNSATATIPHNEVLPNDTNVDVTVIVNTTHAYVGDQVIYHVNVENTGNVELDNMYFIEDSYDDLVFDHFAQTAENWTMMKLDEKRYKFILNQKVVPGMVFGLVLYFNATSTGFKNNTVIASFNSEINSSNATCGVEVLPRIVNITLEKIKADTDRVITVGELAKFHVVIINEGNIALNDVYFIENIPDGLVYMGSEENAYWIMSKLEGNKYRFTYNRTLNPNAMANILLVFNTTSVGIKNNTVTAGYGDVELANAFDFVNVTTQHIPDEEYKDYDLTVEMRLITQGRIYMGDQVEFEVMVKNIGHIHLDAMDFRIDQMPSENLKYVGWDSASSWIDEKGRYFILNRSLSVGDYAAIRLFFKVTGEGPISDGVTATWNNGINHTHAEDQGEALPYDPDITAAMMLIKDKAYVGDDVIYQVVIRNTGNVPLDSIFFTEKEWPNILKFDHYETGDNWIFDETSNTFWLNSSLADGDVSTVMLYFKAIGEGSAANSITAGFDGSETTDATSRNVTVEERTINMTVDKIALEKEVIDGNQVKFEFRIANTGNTDIYNVFVREDKLPEGLVYDSIKSDVPCKYDENTKTFTLDKLEAGDYTTVCLIFNTTSHGVKVNNATFGYNDTVMGYAVANVTVVEQIPEAKVEKITLTNNTEIGSEILFTVNVTNVGEYDIGNLMIVENYAAGLEFVAIEDGEFWKHSIDSQGRDIFTYSKLLEVGQNAVLTLKFKSTSAGVLNNTVHVFNNDSELARATNSTKVLHNTNITGKSIEGKYGQKVNLTANIADEEGNSVKYGNATLVIDGTPYSADVVDGNAIFKDVILPKPGNYDGNITYLANKDYSTSNLIVDVNVAKFDTNVSTSSVEGEVSDVVSVVVNVTDEFGRSVMNGTAVVEICGVSYTANVTDGVVTFEEVVLSSAGTFTPLVSYEGNDYYNPSSATVEISVSKLKTRTIIGGSVEGKVGDVVSITAAVDDELGNPIMNGTATLDITGIPYTAIISNGSVTFNGVVLIDAGNYTALITYSGDDTYESSNAQVSVSVNKLNNTIEADDVVGYHGSVVDIVANVLDQNGNKVLSGTAILEIGPKIADVNGAASGEYTADVVNGKAVFEKVELPAPGLYQGYLGYLGDETYNPSNNTFDITILKVPVDISVDADSGKPGDKVNVTVKVTAKDNSKFNGTVTVKFPDGKTADVDVVDGVGVTQWIVPQDFKSGKYAISAIFDGDEYYGSGNASGMIEVLANNTDDPQENKTNGDASHNIVKQNIARYETGNPILVLIVLLGVIGLIPLKRKN